MDSAQQDLKRAARGRVGGLRLGLRWQRRDTLAGLLQSFAEANQKQGVFSVYQGTNYKQKLVFSNNAE